MIRRTLSGRTATVSSRSFTFLLGACAALLASDAIRPALAVDASFDVVIRKRNGKAKIAKETIRGLTANDRFETANFRVVWKREESALTLARIDEIVAAGNAGRSAADLRLMAANALYHAERARAFYVDVIGSAYVRSLPQVMIRLDLTNSFSEFAHFAHDAYSPQYNNAVTIPAGKPAPEATGVRPWNVEIWFRPRKEVPVSEIIARLPQDPIEPQVQAARDLLYPMQVDLAWRDAAVSILQSRFDAENFLESVGRRAGTVLLLESAFQVMKVLNRFVIPQRYYFDTAFIPEAIYHEFSHVALSDSLLPDHSTPVNEGLADFFATTIGDDPRIAKKIRRFSTAVGKHGGKKKFFQIEFESRDKAQADFVLSLLWGLREELGVERSTRLVHEARRHLSTRESTIRKGLADALLLACERVCESPLRDRMHIQDYLQERGL